jgi:hypothetical protein
MTARALGLTLAVARADCYDDVERYAWSFDDGILVLRLQAPEPCNPNRNSVLQTAAWRRIE